jgi:hypothetical protein
MTSVSMIHSELVPPTVLLRIFIFGKPLPAIQSSLASYSPTLESRLSKDERE